MWDLWWTLGQDFLINWWHSKKSFKLATTGFVFYLLYISLLIISLHFSSQSDNCDVGSDFFIFKYNQQDATLHNSFISAKCCTCFRRFLRPSSGVQKLYIMHLVFVKQLLLPFAVMKGSSNSLTNTRCCMYSFGAPDDGRRNRLKHVEHCAEISELCNVVACWLYLKIHSQCKNPWASRETSHNCWCQCSFRNWTYQVRARLANDWKVTLFALMILYVIL
jgi:hypothetical protein